MKVIEITLRGGGAVRRILADEACSTLLEEIERRVGAVPLDAPGGPRRRRSRAARTLLRQVSIEGHPFYIDPEEIASLTVDEFELQDF